ncbi:hypothetical protein [Clostridium sp. KNHs214]|uniref:hypothetical protein n=1 Tax=Clostridium sp. KNHs214 TaxID=1540257 RepID=UPI00054DCE26|nr:hypothetical protein [Clostridium sp. KNHs214]
MKYIFGSGENFGFKDEAINEILETDIPISNEIYNKFFELQSQGKQFKIKNLQGKTFEEIFEEVIPEPIEPLPQEPSPIEKMQAENKQLKQDMDDMKQNMQQTIAELTMMIATPQ